MFEKFTSSDSNDFRQRYQGTYGYFLSNGKRTLTRLDNIVADGRASFVEFSDRDGIKYLLKPDTEVEGRGFEFIPPKSSYYNLKSGRAVLVKRIPARQYLRGICDRNTSITDMLGQQYPVQFTTLVDLFEEKISPAETLKIALSKKERGFGVAISQQFAACLQTGILRCFEQDIGVVDLRKDVFHVSLDSKDLWHQEILDCFKRANLEVVIK